MDLPLIYDGSPSLLDSPLIHDGSHSLLDSPLIYDVDGSPSLLDSEESKADEIPSTVAVAKSAIKSNPVTRSSPRQRQAKRPTVIVLPVQCFLLSRSAAFLWKKVGKF